VNRDVSGLVGAHDAGTAAGQLVECRRLRVTELVAGPHADERVLRPKGRKHAVANRSGAAVMADLEHVDVAENPLVDQWLQHVTLGVSGQHSRESG
jgi:hypothetical protein